MNKAVKLFKTSIKLDKLYLPAYENLIYVYQELNDEKKALQIYNAYQKARNKLTWTINPCNHLNSNRG